MAGIAGRIALGQVGMSGGTHMVSVGRHTLAATVLGTGAPAVVIEPSFGGWAGDWAPIAQALAARPLTCC
jgi:hypothetical protein